MRTTHRVITTMVLLLLCMVARSQEFFNLTADEVRIDSVMPLFTYTQELGTGYVDSVYTVSLEYPEFIDMTATDVARVEKILGIANNELPLADCQRQLPPMPAIEQYIGVSRKRGTLYVAFTPIVFRDGKFQKLVSFKLTVKGETAAPPQHSVQVASRAQMRAGRPRSFSSESTDSERYASHSVLATGRWAKIRVPSTGVYQLTDALVRQAGFTDVSKVKVYGYGGGLQPEKLTADYITATDDLKEVPTCNVGSRRLFYAIGPVSWNGNTAATRTRNPYSNNGYYFLTENDSTPQAVSEDDFKAAYYPAADDYHTLYEVDDYAWFHGGRNLYDSQLLGIGNARNYQLTAPAGATGRLTVVLSYDAAFSANVQVNGTAVGTITASFGPDKYSKAAVTTKTFNVSELQADNTVTLQQSQGGNVRLDYLSLCFDTPQPWPDLATATFPVPQYVHNITNQDHHADAAADMIIIIPTSQKLLSEAQRLADFHTTHDSLRVRIVPADELYNEFSSGTPDANAYRRYLKMFYDRAETDADMPRYLLLMGDGAWDNRMLTATWKNSSPDDFLLCYESENSFSETDCYVSDDYFCMMDDGEGGNMTYTDKSDVAVGRIPARTADDAKIMVDKTIGYMQNTNAGAWQNTICMMGDDGDNNRHINDAETVAKMVAKSHPAFNIKRVYWDAYTRQSSATGFSYPEVTQIIRQQMQSGALLMNYTGHGAPYVMSHEQVLHLADFNLSSNGRLPLWLTASCDIMPFDGNQENIGETAMLNKTGGAVAFYGTTRTVYAHYNQYMNRAYTRYVLGSDENGHRYTIGEAGRLAKNLLVTPSSQGNDIGTDQTANKLQFTLLGDPALRLAVPTQTLVIDNINGQAANDTATVRMVVGQPVSIKGHVVGNNAFNGVVTTTVRDVEQTIVCKLNNESEAEEPYIFKDRPNTLYTGSDSVRNGQFSIVFALPKDISYTDGTGLITLYAVSSDKQQEAHGFSTAFTMGSDSLMANDGIGPSIYCYLNSSSFANGGNVNTSPMFHADLYDRDGINVSGGGIGHDLELIVQKQNAAETGKQSQTYVLNDYFQYDFGDYRSGGLSYCLPTLEAGSYQLLFRAWDVLNNSSTAELQFNVVKGLEPTVFNVTCTKNPAKTSTSFVITHDRSGSEIDVEIDIYDTSGRQLWQHTERGMAAGQAYTVDWNLTTTGGHRLQTGVYLYRASISCDGSSQVSKANKLIILRQ